MNRMQKVASDISGYEPNKDFTSARHDYYYGQESYEEKWDAVKEYAENVTKVPITGNEAAQIIVWLDEEWDAEDLRWHAFSELGQ